MKFVKCVACWAPVSGKALKYNALTAWFCIQMVSQLPGSLYSSMYSLACTFLRSIVLFFRISCNLLQLRNGPIYTHLSLINVNQYTSYILVYFVDLLMLKDCNSYELTKSRFGSVCDYWQYSVLIPSHVVLQCCKTLNFIHDSVFCGERRFSLEILIFIS